MAFTNLPNELVLLVSANVAAIGLRHLNALCCTCKILYTLINSKLYQQAVEQGIGDAFYKAVQNGRLGTVELFCGAGAKVNLPNFSGYNESPLSDAIRARHKDMAIVKLLLSYGADPSHKDVYGVSELGRLVPMRMMVYKVSDWEVDCARVLIEAGADVDAVWKPGQGPKCMSPLYFAIKFEETRMVRLLLEKGAKVANACMDGKKPSQWARKDTDPELMGMVIEAEKKEMLDSLLGFSRSFRLSGKHY